MNKKEITNHQLSESDLRLLAELEVNARQTTRELAKKVGVSATTVSSRLRRLTELGIVNFYMLGDPQSLGFQVHVHVCLNLISGTLGDIQNTLAQHRCIEGISLTTGRYDIIVSAFFRNRQELIDWMTYELGAITNVSVADKMVVLKVRKRSYRFVAGEGDSLKEVSPRRLNESERKLVEQLDLYPRESIGTLAKRIGISRPEAKSILQSLMDEGIIRVISVVDPRALGLATCTFIFLKVHPHRITEVADTLAAMEKIRHVGIHWGAYDVMAYTAFRDVDEMSRFLREEVIAIPGVTKCETMIELVPTYRSFHMKGRWR